MSDRGESLQRGALSRGRRAFGALAGLRAAWGRRLADATGGESAPCAQTCVFWPRNRVLARNPARFGSGEPLPARKPQVGSAQQRPKRPSACQNAVWWPESEPFSAERDQSRVRSRRARRAPKAGWQRGGDNVTFRKVAGRGKSFGNVTSSPSLCHPAFVTLRARRLRTRNRSRSAEKRLTFWTPNRVLARGRALRALLSRADLGFSCGQGLPRAE